MTPPEQRQRRFVGTLLVLLLAASAIAWGGSCSEAKAQPVPSTLTNAWGYGRYWTLVDWATYWGYTLDAYSWGCSPSGFYTPNRYPCWWGVTWHSAAGQTSVTANELVLDYTSSPPSIPDPDGPWVPTNVYPAGARGYNGIFGAALYGFVEGYYRQSAAVVLRAYVSICPPPSGTC